MTIKKIQLFVFLLSCFAGFGTSKISGSFANNEVSKVYLYQSELLKLSVIDSAEVKKSKFTFKVNDLKGLYFVGASKKNLTPVILNQEEVEIAFSNADSLSNAVVTPLNPTKSYRAYTRFQSQYDAVMQQVNQEFGVVQRKYPPNSPEFQGEFNRLRQRVDSINKAELAFFKTLPSSYECAFSKKLSASFARDGVSKEDYFKASDYTDPLFSQGDFIQRKVNIYLLNYESPNAQSIGTLFRTILAPATAATPQKAAVYEVAVTTSYNLDKNIAKVYAKEYKKQFPEDKRAAELVAVFPPVLFDPAPELKDKSPNGETYALSDLKGKVILLDFWASWCGPCIREMPNVVAAYNKYHEKGFEVFSVSLDSDVNRWKGAISRFNMNWPYHISDLKKWQSEHSRKYGVSGIPATFLIDENGVIIAQNLRGAALDAKLAEIFAE